MSSEKESTRGLPDQATDSDSESTAASATTVVPAYGFESLAGSSIVVHITFAGATYQLRRTRAGKLVLNK